MELFEILNNIGYLCDIHDIEFEINEWGVYITKFYVCNNSTYKFTQSFSFELFKYVDIDDCVLEFERRLEKEIIRRRKQ